MSAHRDFRAAPDLWRVGAFFGFQFPQAAPHLAVAVEPLGNVAGAGHRTDDGAPGEASVEPITAVLRRSRGG